jgi:hypothetical protein
MEFFSWCPFVDKRWYEDTISIECFWILKSAEIVPERQRKESVGAPSLGDSIAAMGHRSYALDPQTDVQEHFVP